MTNKNRRELTIQLQDKVDGINRQIAKLQKQKIEALAIYRRLILKD